LNVSAGFYLLNTMVIQIFFIKGKTAKVSMSGKREKPFGIKM